MVGIEARLADPLLKAPFDGVVGLRNISSGALMRPGDPITTLDDDTASRTASPERKAQKARASTSR